MAPAAKAAVEDGLEIHSGALTPRDQSELADAVGRVIAAAPLFVSTMPRTGKPMSVRMTNCGLLGWLSDRDGGYRYQATHPITDEPWPAMPPALLDIWARFADFPVPPEACLINVYSDSARMGLHRDEDEETFEAPVVSISLGADCLFRVGGHERGGRTRSFRLHSGDVVVLGGESRLAYHGVGRIYAGTSSLQLPEGARINLTLRRVREAEATSRRSS
jgi:alkylated DNA repair protein (DNA oxidative demethylase)